MTEQPTQQSEIWAINQDEAEAFAQLAVQYGLELGEETAKPGDVVDAGSGEFEISVDLVGITLIYSTDDERYSDFVEAWIYRDQPEEKRSTPLPEWQPLDT